MEWDSHKLTWDVAEKSVPLISLVFLNVYMFFNIQDVERAIVSKVIFTAISRKV